MHGLAQKLPPSADRYSNGWRKEDFVARVATPLRTYDPWDPTPNPHEATKPTGQIEKIVHRAQIGDQILSLPGGVDSSTERSVVDPRATLQLTRDWWNPLGAQSHFESQTIKPVDRWFDEVDLPQFTADIRRVDWTAEIFNQPLIRDARSKAKWIVAILQPASLSQRAAWLNAYEEVFLDHVEEKFFRKMRSLAGEIDHPETLIAAITIKDIWQDQNDFQQRRLRGRRMGVYMTDGGTLSWPMAVRIATARHHHDPSTMIDPEWLDDWRALRWSAEGFWSFGEYAVLRAEGEHFEDWQLVAFLRQEEARWSTSRTTPIDDASGMSVTIQHTTPGVPATLVKRYKDWCEKHSASVTSSRNYMEMDF